MRPLRTKSEATDVSIVSGRFRRRFRRGFPLPFLLAAAVSAATLGCSQEGSRTEERNVVPVELTEVTERSILESTSLTGVLNAYREVDVVSEVSGEIVSLNHDVGADIRKGAVLASVEKKALRESLNRAEASVIASEARYELAKQDFTRDSTLHAGGDISEAAHDAGLLAFRSASADLKASKATRELAERDLQKGDIRAPFSGMVSRRFCEIGTYVSPGMRLFRIVNIDTLRLVLNISQADLARVSPETEVEIEVEGSGRQLFQGRIRSIGPEADEGTRTFPIEVVLPNPVGRPLRDGFVVRAKLVLGRREDAVAIPREAVLKRSGGHFIFVAQDSTVHRRAVEIGPLVEDLYVIEKGLDIGELVVTAGMQNLTDGSQIIAETVIRKTGGVPGETP